MLITDRDKSIVKCLARFGPATYAQLARVFQASPEALRQRMPRLARQGLVRRTTDLGEVAVWAATSAGALLTGRPINTLAAHSPGTARTRLLTSIALDAVAAGHLVATQTELVSAARTAALAESLRVGERINVTAVDAPDLEVTEARTGSTTVHWVPVKPRPLETWVDLLHAHLRAGSPPVCVWTDDRGIAETVRSAAHVVHYPDCRVYRLPQGG